MVFIAGRKRSGKTTLMKDLILSWHDEEPCSRFVCWDRTIEWKPTDRLLVLPHTKYTGEEAAKIAIEWAPCTLVMDEVDLAAPNKENGLVKGTAMHTVVHYGRHEQVASIFAARCSFDAHIAIRRLADHIFFFKHTEPTDLDWIARLKGEEWAQAVRDLQPREFRRCDL